VPLLLLYFTTTTTIMQPYNFSDTCKATPETIWETCFSHMKWENWDTDVEAVLEPSGGCENGTTFIFHMKSGGKINCTLKDVIHNETLTFTGPFLGGMGRFDGTVRLIKEDATTTKIDYTFGWGGLLSPLLTLVAGKPAMEGTKTGLENMVRLSEEAQIKK
jgi:hypothetical protein